jgi:hypothetical protein
MEGGGWRMPDGTIVDELPRPGLKMPKAGLSAKEAAKDIPSWAQGERPFVNENGKTFAKRLLDAKYGPGEYPTGPGSEFSKIKKYGDRAFENP